MNDTWTLDLVWWITVVELPALGGLFLFAWRTRRDGELSLRTYRDQSDTEVTKMREKLSSFKLEVAQTYASIPHLKDVERRITRHLVRIENKLDSVPPALNGGRS